MSTASGLLRWRFRTRDQVILEKLRCRPAPDEMSDIPTTVALCPHGRIGSVSLECDETGSAVSPTRCSMPMAACCFLVTSSTRETEQHPHRRWPSATHSGDAIGPWLLFRNDLYRLLPLSLLWSLAWSGSGTSRVVPCGALMAISVSWEKQGSALMSACVNEQRARSAPCSLSLSLSLRLQARAPDLRV